MPARWPACNLQAGATGGEHLGGGQKTFCGSEGDVIGVPEISTEIPYYGSARRLNVSRANPYHYPAYDWMLLQVCRTRPMPASPRGG
jgi:hypothetical protein